MSKTSLLSLAGAPVGFFGNGLCSCVSRKTTDQFTSFLLFLLLLFSLHFSLYSLGDGRWEGRWSNLGDVRKALQALPPAVCVADCAAETQITLQWYIYINLLFLLNIHSYIVSSPAFLIN